MQKKRLSKFDNNLSDFCDIANIELWSCKKCFQIVKNKNKNLINRGREKLNYLSALFLENSLKTVSFNRVPQSLVSQILQVSKERSLNAVNKNIRFLPWRLYY